jgi:AcrR family transcriptional regulator
MARTQGSHSGITGPKVRDAALRLFAEHGFAAVSMRQIAREVGVQAGALYNYTADKQSLLFDLMQSHMDELLAAYEELPDSPDAAQALRQFVDFHIAFHLDRLDAVFISYMELRNLTPENFAQIEAYRRRYEQHLEEILIRGEREGVFAPRDTRISAMALIAMLTGVNTWFREGGRLSLGEVQALYRDMVFKAVQA